MLGPMVNLARVPRGGRNFESMGEDPHLASRMGAAEILGIQSTGVMGCVKHFVV
jgi:beta-glucosidase